MIDLRELFRKLRIAVVTDSPRVAQVKDPTSEYSAPWLVLYNAEQHAKESVETQKWRRKTYGSAARIVLFPNLKQDQLRVIKK